MLQCLLTKCAVHAVRSASPHAECAEYIKLQLASAEGAQPAQRDVLEAARNFPCDAEHGRSQFRSRCAENFATEPTHRLAMTQAVARMTCPVRHQFIRPSQDVRTASDRFSVLTSTAPNVRNILHTSLRSKRRDKHRSHAGGARGVPRSGVAKAM